MTTSFKLFSLFSLFICYHTVLAAISALIDKCLIKKMSLSALAQFIKPDKVWIFLPDDQLQMCVAGNKFYLSI